MRPLKQRRRALNLSQEQVARAADVSLSYYTKLEGTCQSQPTLGLARRIAEVLGTTVDALWPPAPAQEPLAASASVNAAVEGESHE